MILKFLSQLYGYATAQIIALNFFIQFFPQSLNKLVVFLHVFYVIRYQPPIKALYVIWCKIYYFPICKGQNEKIKTYPKS